MNFRVVSALILKFAYICKRNTFRAFDVFLWPTLDLLVWGFVTVYMLKVSNGVPSLVTSLIAAIILWNVLYRAQQVVSVMFLDDLWSKNLLNLFVSPIRSREYVAAGFIMGLAQSIVVTVILGTIAAWCYNYNLFTMGLPLVALCANLILMGWGMGLLTVGVIMRFGPPAEALAWALAGLVQPVSAVFYPVNVLPPWMQTIAWCTPSAHIFEGMRQLISTGQLDANHIWCALVLNAVLMLIAGLSFNFFLEAARRKGLLAKYAA